MLGEARCQHIGQHSRHNRWPQHVIKPVEALANQVCIYVEEEIVHILDRRGKISEP